MALTDPRKRPLGGASGTAPGAAPAAPASGSSPAPAAQPQKQGTGFVNLSSILAANRGAAQQMGNALASGVASQGQQVEQGIQQAAGQFSRGVSSGTPGFNEALGTDRQAIQAGTRATYTGPRTWEEAGVTAEQNGKLTTDANRAQDAARALTTQGGRAALLRQQSPGLTAGGASMDAFLAGAGGGQALRETGARYANLSQILADARGEVTGQVAGAEQAAADAQQRWKDLEAEGYAEDARVLNQPDRAETEQERNLRRRTPRDRRDNGSGV